MPAVAACDLRYSNLPEESSHHQSMGRPEIWSVSRRPFVRMQRVFLWSCDGSELLDVRNNLLSSLMTHSAPLLA